MTRRLSILAALLAALSTWSCAALGLESNESAGAALGQPIAAEGDPVPILQAGPRLASVPSLLPALKAAAAEAGTGPAPPAPAVPSASPQRATEPALSVPSAATAPAEPLPQVETPPQQEPSQIKLSATSPALTETLNRTLEMLARERAENERLKERVQELGRDLTEKERTIAELQGQIEAFEGDVQALNDALGKWQTDVLGFRDEMRQAEEAEIEVLQKILTLLTDFAEEEPQ